MDILKRLKHLLTLVLDGVIASFFAFIIIITIVQVILRYVFNASILGGNEAMEALFIYTTAIGAAVAVRRRQHININYFVQLLPMLFQRLVDITVHILIAFLNGVMIYYSINWISKVGNNESPVMRVPEWIFQLSIPIGCGLVIIYCLIIIVLDIWDKRSVQGDEIC
ncbi:MAG: TRAP transporter small permease [Desulfocapsaceae bacterium]|jgi:TRAP-type C4-dicarboxylate transport system permease small subunit|nr:TRAP transporter small permease [Desulfocapsaceae bacterium]